MSGRHGDDDHDGIINRNDPDSELYEGVPVAAARAAAAPRTAGGLTGTVIRNALSAVGAVGGQIASYDALAAGASGALLAAPAGLTVAGAAAFLATMAEESAHFRTTTEYGHGQTYAPYVGRTFEQITWSGNYAAFGAWCHDHGLVADPQVFVRNPTSLSDYRWAWLGGVWYFAAHNLWRYANAGNFLAVSQAVNGGDGRVGTSFTPNGWAERQALYRAFTAAGPALLPTAAAADTGEPMFQDHYPLFGADVDIWDVACGPASKDGRWIYLTVTLFAGTITGWVDFQDDHGGIGTRQPVNLTVGGNNLSPRAVLAVPAGATKARIGWDATHAQKACLTVTGGR